MSTCNSKICEGELFKIPAKNEWDSSTALSNSASMFYNTYVCK